MGFWDVLRTRILDIQRELSPDAPEVLHHYTDATALIAILNSHTMWASRSGYLNDRTEHVYGMSVVSRALDGVMKKPLPPHIVQALSELRAWSETGETSEGPFIVCFCEHGDLLEQWRGYGRNSGFALGFESAKLKRIDGFQLRKVLYDDRQQDTLAELSVVEVVTQLIKWGQRALPDAPADVGPSSLQPLRAILALAAAGMKHKAFASEQEWRLIADHSDTGNPQGLKFRASAGRVVPYVDVDLGLDGSGTLPLKTVSCGPRSEPDLERRALKQLLASCGYGQIEPLVSDVPLRS